MAESQLFEPLNVARLFPLIVENHGLAGVLLSPMILLGSFLCEDFWHEFVYGPSLRCNTTSHTMNHLNAGLCLYIRPLGGPHRCPGLGERRVHLLSTTAFCGPTMCPGSERAGCPSGVITDRPRCILWCESSWCDAAPLLRKTVATLPAASNSPFNTRIILEQYGL